MKKIKYKKLLYVLLSIVGIIVLAFSIKIYIDNLNKKTQVSEEKEETIITVSDIKNELDGFKSLRLTQQILSTFDKYNVNQFTLKVKDETVYFLLVKSGDGFEISKIGDTKRDVNAYTSYRDAISIRFQHSESDESTVFKIIGEDFTKYMTIVNNGYYALGEDIDSIEFIEDQFYYYSYNKKYSLITENLSCAKKITSQISEYKSSDVYYSYGIINFFEDHYQKIAINQNTVKDFCNELNKN